VDGRGEEKVRDRDRRPGGNEGGDDEGRNRSQPVVVGEVERLPVDAGKQVEVGENAAGDGREGAGGGQVRCDDG
jgi:hypothetical protein